MCHRYDILLSTLKRIRRGNKSFFSKVFKAQRFKVDMSEFPVIMRLYERLGQLQPFIEAHPDNQIDSIGSSPDLHG